jgi:hypothetical protein
MTSANLSPGASNRSLLVVFGAFAVLFSTIVATTAVLLADAVSSTRPAGHIGPLPTALRRTPPGPGPPAACRSQPLGTLYYANLSNLEGRHAFGPSLVPAGLNPHPREGTQLSAKSLHTAAVVREFWKRLCLDPVLANATLATLDPNYNVRSHTGRPQVLGHIRNDVDWSHARLWYGIRPANSWTYFMVPGHPPTLGAAPYPHGASWFLDVRDHNGREVKFRLPCGGQGVFDLSRLDPTIPRA